MGVVVVDVDRVVGWWWRCEEGWWWCDNNGGCHDDAAASFVSTCAAMVYGVISYTILQDCLV
jgi:hypothetical protein